MRPLPGLEEAPGRELRPEANTPWAPRRPGDSLAGGFPAEPASASPSGVLQQIELSPLQPLDIGGML